jgi:endonuclease/exonuclease/phosphatase family metal-dependent hydrolase
VRLDFKRRRRPALPPAVGPGLVVATYNIPTCVGVDRRYDPARIASVLAEIDADIIGLQEVDARRRGDLHHDQWEYLGAETGMTAIPGPNVDDHRGRFGNALLTRWPVLAVRLVDLSVAGCEPRGAIDVDIAVDDRTLRVVATHFGLRAPERREQTERLLAAIVTGPRPDAIVVMGDLNEWRGRRGGIPALDRHLGKAPAPRTFPSWCPLLPLDRIYAGRPAVLQDVEAHRSSLSRLASDHLPLCARITWEEAA